MSFSSRSKTVRKGHLAKYAVIRRFAKSVIPFSLIHFKARLISGTEIIGSLNTRAASLKSICLVIKVRSAPQKSTHLGAFFVVFRLRRLLLQLFFSEQVGEQSGTQITLARGGQNHHDILVGECLIFLQLQRSSHCRT